MMERKILANFQNDPDLEFWEHSDLYHTSHIKKFWYDFPYCDCQEADRIHQGMLYIYPYFHICFYILLFHNLYSILGYLLASKLLWVNLYYRLMVLSI